MLLTSHLLPVPWCASVEPPVVLYVEIFVQNDELRCASSPEGLGNTLRFIKQVWEGELFVLGQLCHKLRSILRMRRSGVGRDGKNLQRVCVEY